MRQHLLSRVRPVRQVSIHAPREGCDRGRPLRRRHRSIRFNSRTPGGVRRHQHQLSFFRPAFQFTHPGRGATITAVNLLSHLVGFNSRTPGGVRPNRPHSLTVAIRFQFTHPGRGATQMPRQKRELTAVSIHAPREGCDNTTRPVHACTASFNSRTPGGVRRDLTPTSGGPRRFNSRTPGGVRLVCSQPLSWPSVFQFTHPGRGATLAKRPTQQIHDVSIHAPREGCDQSGQLAGREFEVFQFTHPGRGATSSSRPSIVAWQFQFTHPGRGATAMRSV